MQYIMQSITILAFLVFKNQSSECDDKLCRSPNVTMNKWWNFWALIGSTGLILCKSIKELRGRLAGSIMQQMKVNLTIVLSWKGFIR